MLNRANIASFLQGLFVMPLAAGLGFLTALLFQAYYHARWNRWGVASCAGFYMAVPLFGALKTRQRSLVAGLLAGLAIVALATGAAWSDPSNEAGKPLTGFVICIDPGHTSETSAGTVSTDGKLSERHVNWMVGVLLQHLAESAGARVVMTKQSENEYVTNRQRAEIANAAHADLLLRLHCDAGPQSGIATYYPDRQGTRFGVTGPSITIIRRSRLAAQSFHPAIVAALRDYLADRGILGDSQTFVGRKQGALTGSIFAQVPALTVEMCVLTNAHDYAFVRTPAGQSRIARALLCGLESFWSASVHARQSTGS